MEDMVHVLGVSVRDENSEMFLFGALISKASPLVMLLEQKVTKEDGNVAAPHLDRRCVLLRRHPQRDLGQPSPDVEMMSTSFVLSLRVAAPRPLLTDGESIRRIDLDGGQEDGSVLRDAEGWP